MKNKVLDIPEANSSCDLDSLKSREIYDYTEFRKDIQLERNTVNQDLWRQRKRVSISVFNGDKKYYENWKSAFYVYVDQTPATPECKLLQLKQYLSGEALKVMENLGHFGFAYEAAKERLE